MGNWTSSKLCDFGNLVLGVFMGFSPWIFAFPPGIPTANAVICGVLIVCLSIAALVGFAAWEEWGNMLVGLWLMISPWILGLQPTQAVSVQFTIGVIVAVFAKNEIWFRAHRETDHV